MEFLPSVLLFCPIFSSGPRDLYHLNCLGVGTIIKILSFQLMLHEGTSHLLLLSSCNICFKAGENFKSIALELKLEGMTKE